jgi:tetratricopeptide (TPR) repeat protein
MSKPKSKSTVKATAVKTRFDRENSNGFMANLRQALEHVGDAEWLKANAPLESIRTLATGPAATLNTPVPYLGIKELDERLKAIWQDWQTREQTGLQALLWSAVRHIKPTSETGTNFPALLLLTYFQDPRPKQGDLIKELAVGQSTYYRQLAAAVQALEQSVVSLLQPSLRLESPTVKPLIGRAAELQNCLAALRTGGVVSLIGAAGLGKTSLGAMLAHEWSKPNLKTPFPTHHSLRTFWFTFRPGLTDNVQLLMFALALFMHQQGQSNLWLQLLAKPQEGSAGGGTGKALAMIAKSLEALKDAPPLFCFDEVDTLLPNELEDNDERQQLRAFLEAFAELPRGGAPVLLIGQRLLMEPERGHVFSLSRFGIAETRALLHSAELAADEATCERVLNYTRGNPLLLQLLITLHQLGEPVLHNVGQLAATASLDWFLARLRRHLTAKELDLLDALSVFDSPAPASLWRKQSKVLDRLAQLSLVQRDHGHADQISLLPAVRDAVYRQLPADVRHGLHIAAAQGCANQGAFTLAAHHFVLGQQPELAIWTWHAHRDTEIRQGQTQTAWRIFTPLRYATLTHEQDRRALALILAEVCNLLGKHEDGLEALNGMTWPSNRVSTARAKELRARLLMRRGDIEAALKEYRASLETVTNLTASKRVALRKEVARQSLIRARDIGGARHEVLLAQHDVELLLADIEDESGRLDKALEHLRHALVLAQRSNDPVRLAKSYEGLGILEARCLNPDIAQQHLKEAARYFAQFGDIISAEGMTSSNSAFAFLMAQRFAEAIAPAQKAIRFFEEMKQPYELALNEANLAEAHANLNQAEPAEQFVLRALAHEEPAVQAQCLYVLGHVRRLQRRFDEAEQLCKDAIKTAVANSDPWSEAYAWRTLGDVYREWGQVPAAREAFETALARCSAIHYEPGMRLAQAALAQIS